MEFVMNKIFCAFQQYTRTARIEIRPIYHTNRVISCFNSHDNMRDNVHLEQFREIVKRKRKA